jgi:hypothetical protein
MTAENITELVKLFDDDKRAAEFARSFLQAYLVPAFGVLPKTEIDLRVFKLLVEAGAANPNGSVFTLARSLNITPAKARSLIFQYQLRHVSEADTDKEVLQTIAEARYWKDGGNLAFGVESPLVRAAISAKLRQHGVFADVSLSGDILKVSPDQFGEVLVALLPASVAQDLTKKIAKQGVEELDVKEALKKYVSDVANKFISEKSNDGLNNLLRNGCKTMADSAPEAMEYLFTAIVRFF